MEKQIFMKSKRWNSLLKYDFVCGMWNNRYRWAVCFGVFVFLADLSVQTCNMADIDAGYLGYYTYLMQGLPEYIRTETSIFQLPVPWLIFHGYLFFLICSYPVSDLSGCGQQIMLLSEKRERWWLGKVCWCVWNIFFYYVSFNCIMLVMSRLRGNFFKNTDGLKNVLGIDAGLVNAEEFIMIWACLPVLFSIALGLVQMVLGILIKPVAAYFFTMSYLITSVYWTTPFLLGNFAMILRNRPIITDGLSSYMGMLLCAGVSGAAIFTGRLIVKKKDILEVEK